MMTDNNPPKLMVFKVSLKHLKPQVWRRVAVPYEYTFKDLHFVIQDLLNWSNFHLHKFCLKSKRTGKSIEIGGGPDLGFGDCEFLPESTKLADIFKNLKDSCEYEYDFGSPWYHVIVLENIIFGNINENYPKCISGKRASPPEEDPGSDYDEFAEERDYFNPLDIKFRAHKTSQDFDPFKGMKSGSKLRQVKTASVVAPVKRLQELQNISANKVTETLHEELTEISVEPIQNGKITLQGSCEPSRKRSCSPENISLKKDCRGQSYEAAQNLINRLENEDEDVEDIYGKYIASQMRLIQDLERREQLRIEIQQVIKKFRFGK